MERPMSPQALNIVIIKSNRNAGSAGERVFVFRVHGREHGAGAGEYADL